MRTAYFLGAGASHSLDPTFPLARDLTIEKLLDRSNYAQDSYMTVESPDRVPDVISELRQAFALGRIPIEHLTARLEDVLESFSISENEPGLRERILFLVMKRLTLADHAGKPPLSSLLRDARRTGDLFLTTNYDTLIEWELGIMLSRHQWSPPDSGGPEPLYWLDWGVPDALLQPLDERDVRAREILGGEWRCLPFLKLHGSVSWSGCAACRVYHLDPLYKDGASDSIGRWLTCDRCNGYRTPIFVPPIDRKDINTHLVIRAIWDRAQQELMTVNRIVFVGFSLDPSDTNVRQLLERTDGRHLESVLVVDPKGDGEVGDRFRQIYGDRVAIGPTSWRSFLDSRLGIG